MSKRPAVTALLATAALVGGAVQPAQAHPHTGPRPATGAQKRADASSKLSVPSSFRSTRQQTLRRARVWLTANRGRPVPYSQTKRWKDGYRQDCSGYASMALGLPKPGPNTVNLATSRGLTRQIPMSRLKPGDLVIDAIGGPRSRHVVIFESWNNAAHNSYTAFDQNGGHNTQHHARTYGLSSGSQYKAYRPVQYGD